MRGLLELLAPRLWAMVFLAAFADLLARAARTLLPHLDPAGALADLAVRAEGATVFVDALTLITAGLLIVLILPGMLAARGRGGAARRREVQVLGGLVFIGLTALALARPWSGTDALRNLLIALLLGLESWDWLRLRRAGAFRPESLGPVLLLAAAALPQLWRASLVWGSGGGEGPLAAALRVGTDMMVPLALGYLGFTAARPGRSWQDLVALASAALVALIFVVAFDEAAAFTADLSALWFTSLPRPFTAVLVALAAFGVVRASLRLKRPRLVASLWLLLLAGFRASPGANLAVEFLALLLFAAARDQEKGSLSALLTPAGGTRV